MLRKMIFLTAIFQSTLPVWGATVLSCGKTSVFGYFNPRSPCGERPFAIFFPVLMSISIHAPRVGSDFQEKRVRCRRKLNFNPRSPCGERQRTIICSVSPLYFNPRSPCGERPALPHQRKLRFQFQSTLPVWGATIVGFVRAEKVLHFNPRSPCGERRSVLMQSHPATRISIHAPRVGSDQAVGLPALPDKYFNPRSPCGERLDRGVGIAHIQHFNPRSPCGERRCFPAEIHLHSDISIHAPRVGSDVYLVGKFLVHIGFQSTLPVWGATATEHLTFPATVFQSTLPVWGATFCIFSR